MADRSPKPLPPPTAKERSDALLAAEALRAWLDDPSTGGTRTVMHLDLSGPRRGEWWETWENLQGFKRVNGRYRHALLPGWEYTGAEIALEMIPDLEKLATTGERPTESTR